MKPASPFPINPVIGAFGEWAGDTVETAEEVAAAQVYQPSVMSMVLAGERVVVQERQGRRDAEARPFSTADLDQRDRALNFIPAPPLNAHGLAALPVSDAVIRAHEDQVRRLDHSAVLSPAPGTLRWNLHILGWEFIPACDMDAVAASGAEIKATLHF